MTDIPQPTPPPLPVIGSKNLGQKMAQASWIAAIVGILVDILGSVVDAFRGSHSFVSHIVSLLVFVCGIVVGITALIGIARFGKKKILWPAIIGICLNVPSIAFGLTGLLFVAVSNVHVHLEPAVHSPSAHLLKDEPLQFSMDVPEGFKEFPEGKQQPNDIYSFIQHFPDRNTDIGFVIRQRDRPFPRGELSVQQLGQDFKGEILHPSWRGLNINATLETAKDGNFTGLTYTVVVPLKPKAIQLNIVEAGPDPKREEIESLVSKLLDSLDGETNW